MDMLIHATIWIYVERSFFCLNLIVMYMTHTQNTHTHTHTHQAHRIDIYYCL